MPRSFVTVSSQTLRLQRKSHPQAMRLTRCMGTPHPPCCDIVPNHCITPGEYHGFSRDIPSISLPGKFRINPRSPKRITSPGKFQHQSLSSNSVKPDHHTPPRSRAAELNHPMSHCQPRASNRNMTINSNHRLISSCDFYYLPVLHESCCQRSQTVPQTVSSNCNFPQSKLSSLIPAPQAKPTHTQPLQYKLSIS